MAPYSAGHVGMVANCRSAVSPTSRLLPRFAFAVRLPQAMVGVVAVAGAGAVAVGAAPPPPVSMGGNVPCNRLSRSVNGNGSGLTELLVLRLDGGGGDGDESTMMAVSASSLCVRFLGGMVGGGATM
jgi:hypothetical protein